MIRRMVLETEDEMDAESPQVETKQLIEADLGDNGGSVKFSSIKEASDWIDGEIKSWDGFARRHGFGETTSTILKQQLQLPREIQDALAQTRLPEGGDQSKALQAIQGQFGRYADYRSVCSKSELGNAIQGFPKSRTPSAAIGALASALGIPAHKILRLPGLNESDLVTILSGYAIGTTFNVVKRSDLPEHQSRMDEQLGNFDKIVKQAERERRELTDQEKATNDDISDYVKNQRDLWAEFFESAKSDWKGLKNAYEEQLHLQAPATYWRKQARKTSRVAMIALVCFAGGAISIAAGIVTYGPNLLAGLAAIPNIGDFGTLAMLSIPTLTVLWILRQIARLFVTNLERSADAKMRETMATTFLALTKAGIGTVSEKERLMVLEALFRPPGPHNADDGQFGGALEILTRRNSQG